MNNLKILVEKVRLRDIVLESAWRGGAVRVYNNKIFFALGFMGKVPIISYTDEKVTNNKDFIIYNRLSGKYRFSDRPTSDPNELSIPILKVKDIRMTDNFKEILGGR